MSAGVVRLVAVVGILALAAGLWFLLTGLGVFSAFLLPPPAIVGAALGSVLGNGTTYRALLTTVWEILAAFALAAAGGLAVGIPAGLHRVTRRAYEPLLSNLAAIPLIVVYPVFLAVLGVGSASKVAFGAATAFFAVALATLAGVGSIEPTLLTAARALGGRGTHLLRRVVIPGALPQIRNGLRLAVVLATLAVVAGEFIGGENGLGYLLASAGQAFRTPEVYAYVIVTLALAAALQLGVSALIRATERGGA
ncbi:MAG TPA: ABC transporter permease subunit [Acidimicrobiales bacterium]|nr:ABC transporter permease subunit [Acidimicrobiales bacterium]